MATEYSISPANLHEIEHNLQTVFQNLDTISDKVSMVGHDVSRVSSDLSQLKQAFNDYLETAGRQHNLSIAETRLIKLRQELETKYGHYAEVRRTTIGILQADDLAIVRRETITETTEKLMLSTPDYWLAPCLVALAAWIDDKSPVAERALREALRRNDEKASLLLALICRRAGRKSACLEWTQRYFSNQDAENLDRKCVVMLDAFTSGLLGVDSEGLVSRQIMEWLGDLSEKPGFVERQIQQWTDAIEGLRPDLQENRYPYLEKYSGTWPVLKDTLSGAYLNGEFCTYLDRIFAQSADILSLKQQLDEITNRLVTDFDDEELPLRMDEKRHQLIVDFDGDIDQAQARMKEEQTAFDTHKDFTQLLTDAAMKPESAHNCASTQKFAVALSKEWISTAYSDITAHNRMKFPAEISMEIAGFHTTTKDGHDEDSAVDGFEKYVDREKEETLAQVHMSGFAKFGFLGGPALLVLGIWMPVLIVLGALLLIYSVVQWDKQKKARVKLAEQFEEKRESGTQVVRAIMAEVVDFKDEFAKRDEESETVIDFLEQIAPEHYIQKIADSVKKINV